MKTNIWRKTMVLAAVGLTTSFTALAQNAPAPAPQLSYGVQEILRLEQAKVSDDVVVAYVRSSAMNYSLTADQIIYLRQQGVSSVVIGAMLNAPNPSVAANPAPAPAPAPVATETAPAQPAPAPAPQSPTASVTYVQPTTTYVQTVPTTTYYYSEPDYYPSYYAYPAYGYGYGYGYGWYPPVSLSFGFGWHGGWGGGWHGGGGWRGGGGGGWHGGGGHR